MTTPPVRPDLLRGLLQSCYVIEHARTGLQRKWGGDFDGDSEGTGKRADRLGRLLDERGIRRPDEVIAPHTDWFESLCGSVSTEVPLGAAALHNFGKWGDVFCAAYLDDIEEFRALGAEHTRVEADRLTMSEEESILPEFDLPEGRRFVILTDVHIGSTGRDELARKAIADINRINPIFVVIPGDITDDGEPEQFHQAKELLGGLTCPYYIVPGNHDAVRRSTREPVGAKFFRDAFGEDPHDHIVECGDLQVALVDSTDPTASPFPDWDLSRIKVEGESAGVDSGALRPGQAVALADRLDKNRPVLLIQHHELHPFSGFPPVKFAMREEDAEAELEALSGHNLVGVVAGHTHRSAVLGIGDGSIAQLEIPSLKDWPFTYSVAGVTNDSVKVVVRQISDRSAVWDRSLKLMKLMQRFAAGPLSEMTYKFEF